MARKNYKRVKIMEITKWPLLSISVLCCVAAAVAGRFSATAEWSTTETVLLICGAVALSVQIVIWMRRKAPK